MSRPRKIENQNLPVWLHVTRSGRYRMMYRGKYVPLETSDRDEAIKRYWEVRNGSSPYTWKPRDDRKRSRPNKGYEYPKCPVEISKWLSPGGPR